MFSMASIKNRWGCCPGNRTVCCCCSVRTGASVIGWFNFVVNSLYVGMLVFALARIKENIHTQVNTYQDHKRLLSMQTNTKELATVAREENQFRLRRQAPTQFPPTTQFPTINPPTEILPTNLPTQFPPTNLPTEILPTNSPTQFPPTNPPTEIPSTNPPTEIPPTNPPTQFPPTNPPTEISPTNPPTEIPPTNPPSQFPATNPPTQFPPFNPPTEIPPTNPPTQFPPTNPPSQFPPTNPPTQNPSTNPPTQFSTTKPTTQNPDTLPSNSHPRNISLEPRCTDSNNCCQHGLPRFILITSSKSCQEAESVHDDCICELLMIANGPVPLLYSSTAIPAIMIVFSILWLTTVESRTKGFISIVGHVYMACIFIQPFAQLGFLVYANNKFTSVSIKPLHTSVWLVFSAYAVTNVYFFPTLYKYVKLRKQEFYQGLDQGLLTSERHPPTTKTMDVYLEDAFAIDDDTGHERYLYRKTDYGGLDDGNVVEYDFLSEGQRPSEPKPHDVFT